MSDMSNKWDKQWSVLLTHCHGESVEANPAFQAGLLAQLKRKTAENLEKTTVSDVGDDEKWSRLMKATYVPCHHDEAFKSALLGKLAAKQRQISAVPAVPAVPAAAVEINDTVEDKVLRTILTHSYQPVVPRKEFETRLLDNLKDRQRNTVVLRRASRRRSLFLSAASGIAAAAMVMFVVWVGPASVPADGARPAESRAFASLPIPPTASEVAGASVSSGGNLVLPLPEMTEEAAVASAAPASSSPSPTSTSGTASLRPLRPGSANAVFASSNVAAVAAPASFASSEVVPASFAHYNVDDAFSGPALPDKAFALQNIEVNAGQGWVGLSDSALVPLVAGMAFRSRGGMGHVTFSDGSIITVSPNALMTTSERGLTVERGLALVSAPEASRAGFRLHFPERDIALEPGTDLAVMVESSDGYAEGGTPAPMVMVVDRQDSPGGLALARSDNGVGPLFAKQLYRLDRYVTPALPGRALCETECQDLDKFFKMETVRQVGHPMASFAGGFAADRDMGFTATVITPAGYTKRGDKWISDKYQGQETVRLPYLSDAYFGFANARRDLARDLALGSEVIIDGGDGKFYEIVK